MENNTEELNQMKKWAENEIELAVASEKKAAAGSHDWTFGASCYYRAINAYRSLLNEDSDIESIQITKGILNRLIDGKCLTPIEDTDDVWIKLDVWSNNGEEEYQCKRMSSLFKKITADGTVTYSDIRRVQCFNIENPRLAHNNGFATRLVDKIFPISMPYLPSAKPFQLFREEFLINPSNRYYDTVAFLYILMPDGRKVELNRYFKEDETGQLVSIEKDEYEDRKAKRVAKQ